jgi:hypothetical protein
MFVETSIVGECARRSEAAMKRQIDQRAELIEI